MRSTHILCISFLSVVGGVFAMDRTMDFVGLSVVAAATSFKSDNQLTYIGITNDSKKIEIEVCTKLRKTRSANPLDVHYSGKIGKKRITRDQAKQLVPYLKAALRSTYLHPAALAPAVKKEAS